MRKNFGLWIGVILMLIISQFYSCSKDKENNSESANREILGIMDEYYLWYQHLPDLNPADYSTPMDFITALRYEQYDRWSFVITKEEYYQYFQAGEMIGHGFILSRDNDNNIRIAMVYPATNAYNQGVRRGWIVNKINDVTATPDNINNLIGDSNVDITNKIEFTNNQGQVVTLNLKKQVINIKPVVYSDVIEYNNEKIGYMVFQDFIDVANHEIDSVFGVFRQENISDLIVDLRYNGGGSLDVAVHLAGWLTGNTNANQVLNNNVYNDKHQDLNSSDKIPYNASSLDLNRIVFIGTSNTASASELTINGMKPYMDVTLVGSPTHGKPVGMHVFSVEDYAVFPVMFRYTNAQGVGDFYNGLQPDILANDDITHDFGDVNETMLNSALNYIAPGIITKSTKSTFAPELITTGSEISEFYRGY